MLSDEYIAGFMDGEGSFLLYTVLKKGKLKNGEVRMYPYTSARVSVANTHRPVLEQMRERYGGLLLLKGEAGVRRATKNCYALFWRRDEMKILLPRIIPFLVEKKERAQAVLDYLESRNKV